MVTQLVRTLLAAADNNGHRLATIVAGGRAWIRLQIESWHKYINFYINLMNQTKSFDGGHRKGMCKAAHPWGGVESSNSRCQRGEGLAASTPCWWCLLGDLCFLCGFWLVTHQSDMSYLHFRGVTKCPTQACTIPWYCSFEKSNWGILPTKRQ